MARFGSATAAVLVIALLSFPPQVAGEGVVIEGIVVDAKGRPIPFALVSPMRMDQPGVLDVVGPETRTRADGTFSITMPQEAEPAQFVGLLKDRRGIGEIVGITPVEVREGHMPDFAGDVQARASTYTPGW